MTTIINPGNSDNSGVGLIVGVIVTIVIVILFFVFALPAIRGNRSSGTNINVEIPTPGNTQAQ